MFSHMVVRGGGASLIISTRLSSESWPIWVSQVTHRGNDFRGVLGVEKINYINIVI